MDLFFAGAGTKQTRDYIKNSGLCKLFSQLLDRKEIDEFIQYKKENNNKIKIFIDSGAFSVHKSNAKVNVDEYIEYLNSIDEWYYLAAQVDSIPGKFGEIKNPVQIEKASKESWQNYIYI